ncbi:MAG: HAD family phosphatase [Planctomycetota bacterium]|nr:HAD family phosphatase [Planctomycetota bacterium]
MNESAPSVKAVVFDLDGLMFNTEDIYLQVGSEVLRRRNKQFTPELVDAMMGLRPAQAIARMIEWHDLTDTVEQIEKESRDIFTPLLDTQLAPMPGLIALLDAIESADIPKAIATSSSRRFAEEVLGRFDLIERFAFLLSAEDVHRGKPDPEIYQLAASRLGISTTAMLVLEDSQTGLTAAVASGACAVAVPGIHSARHDFSQATWIASGLSDPKIYALLSLPMP